MSDSEDGTKAAGPVGSVACAKHQHGLTVWLTGLPASGKTTIAKGLVSELGQRDYVTYCLDGDRLRQGLCSDLGFTPVDRHENVRRAAEMSATLADAGLISVVAMISPYSLDRAAARLLHEQRGLGFLEVLVDAPVQVCEQRDPKRLYALAHLGEITGMTGVDAPYEIPDRADLVLHTATERPGESIHILVEAVMRLDLRGALTSRAPIASTI
jgi:bifunctional enzyme CysN/CysC